MRTVIVLSAVLLTLAIAAPPGTAQLNMERTLPDPGDLVGVGLPTYDDEICLEADETPDIIDDVVFP